jgi:hypothetical protein
MKQAWRRLSACGLVLMLACGTRSFAQQAAAKFPSAAKRDPAAVTDPSTAAGVDDAAQREQARLDYVLHCSGCHFMHGEGNPGGGIPRVRDQIGYLLTLPEGRAYLMQVPGLLSAGLPDADAAHLINWMLDYFGGSSMPADFAPYTGAEAREYRLHKPADIIAMRKRLAAQLRAAGYPFQ